MKYATEALQEQEKNGKIVEDEFLISYRCSSVVQNAFK